MTQNTETVTCTNCGSTLEVHERYAGHFRNGNDGVCKSCYSDRDMPEPTEPKNAYEEIKRDMRGEYRDWKRNRVGR